MKKIIIYVLLMMLSISLINAISCDYGLPYSINKGVYYDLKDTNFHIHEPVDSVFGYNLWADTKYYDTSSIIDFREYEFGDPSGGLMYVIEDDLPFYIAYCDLMCDTDSGYMDYWITFDFDEDSQYFDTDRWRFEQAFRCTYGDEYLGQTVKQRVGCTLVPNTNYAGITGAVDPYCQLNIPYDNCYVNQDSGQRQCYDYWEISFTIEGDGNMSNNITQGDINQDNTTISPEDGDGTIPDKEGITKQLIYEDLEDDIRKKNIFLNSMIWIMEVVFSFILIIFYLFELAITLYVFTVWIPSIARSIVKLLRKFGGTN